jgi:hypothetical protein
MSALTVNGDLNIMGKFKINGEPIDTLGCECESFDNKITGDLEFLENKTKQGSISGLKVDGVSCLKLKSDKILVNGDLEVSGAGGPVSITTDEQPTGEKFLGRDVYIKGWEGQLTGAKTNADFIVSNFLPSASCRVLSYGGDVMYDCDYNTSIIIGLWGNLNFYKSGADIYFVKGIGGMQEDSPNLRFWVKYTHE